jgi:prepilin-type N-terminal cleavage/methylation domain-containing protein
MTTLIQPQRTIRASAEPTIQSGFTLIELMVAMTVALLVSAGAAALFANTIFNTRTLNSATAINEEANRINALLARNFRMSGYVDWLSNSTLFAATDSAGANPALYNLQTPGVSLFQNAFKDLAGTSLATVPVPLSGCEGSTETDTGYNAPTNPLDVSCKTTSKTSNTLSAVTVAYQVTSQPSARYTPTLPNRSDATNTPSNITGMFGDCNNQATTNLYTVNRFYLKKNNPSDWLATDTTILYDLMCQGPDGNAAQPLTSNIEQWVLMYGLPPAASPAASGSIANDDRIERYLTASEVSAANSWNLVVAIRSCILIAGTRGSATVNPNTPVGTNTTRRDCLGNLIKTNVDARLRQAFTQTVSLRGQIHTSNMVE